MSIYNISRAEKFRAAENRVCHSKQILYCIEDEYGILQHQSSDKEAALKLLRLAIEKKADGLRDSVAEKLEAYSSYGDAYSDEQARVAYFYEQEKRVDDAAREAAKACFTLYKKIILDLKDEDI